MIIDQISKTFQNVQVYADANGHGNQHGVLTRIIRDLESLRDLPDEAWQEVILEAADESEPISESQSEPIVEAEPEPIVDK